MTGAPLEAEIVRLLAERPRKAAELARALDAERSAVNALLYGRLKGRVEQDRGYRWRLRTEGEATAEPAAARNAHAGLFAYYLDCLAADAGVEVSVFAVSRHGLDYAQLAAWPGSGNGEDWRQAEPVRRLVAAQRRQPKAKALWLGWPTLVRRARSRTGWEGAFVEPLLLWPVETEGEAIRIAADPLLNARALARLFGDDHAAAETAELAAELGLDDAEDIDPADLGARLRHLHPDWPWLADADPETLADTPLDDAAVAAGIHNVAAIVLGDRTSFTAGLEAELKQLQSVADADIARSALGALLKPVDTAGGAASDGAILEVTPLNAEQREAVARALAQPVTVVTGPPGTGKSQVVTAILANAAYRGQRVLFASKNNQAVDVVEERVNALTTRPLLLRLGPRAAQAALADRLMRLLSTRTDAAAQEAGARAAARVDALSRELAALDARAEAMRTLANDLARTDAELDELRTRLGQTRWSALAAYDAAFARPVADALALAERRADPAAQNPLLRLVWPLLRAARLAALADAQRQAAAHAAELGISEAVSAAALHRGIDAAETARRHWDGRAELARLGTAARIAMRRTRLQRALGAESLAAFEGWLAGLADRLSREQRASLGDYVAMLRQIASAGESSGPVSKQMWARYYQLADKAAGALPGWAVTSLSARGRVPFVPAAFDLVVIDEASQCDIASVLPLLFRARRAVIIGDPQQLSHITRLSPERDAALMVRHGVMDVPGPGWSYGKASLYALAASRVPADSVVQLRDHHRSHPDIVRFSNRHFYEGTLRVATDFARLRRPEGGAVRWIDVQGAVQRPTDGGAVNDAEAKAVVAELERLVLQQHYGGTIGVVTPFRAQGRRIRELATRNPALAQVLAARDFLSETADKFQGDERDLMLFSPVLAAGMTRGAVGFLRRERNRFNVALTRARAALVIVGDRTACASGDVPLLAQLAEHVAGLDAEEPVAASPSRSMTYPRVAVPDESVSDWEKLFYVRLAEAGIFTMPQHPVDQYRLDLALVLDDGRRLDIEVDGERWHRDPWTGEHLRRDQLRDMRLMEMGWGIRRFWVADVRDDPDGCVATVREWMSG